MNMSLIWIGALQVLLTLIGLGRAKALAVMLSPAGFGIVSTIDQLMVTVVQLGGLGLPFAALRYMAAAHSEGAERFQLVGAGFARTILVLGILSALLLLMLLYVRPGWMGHDLAPYVVTLRVAALTVPTTMLTIFAVHALAAAQRPIAGAALNCGAVLAIAVGGIWGLSVRGLTGFYVGAVLAGLMVVIGTATGLRAVLGVRWLGRRVAPQALPNVVATSASAYVILAFASVAMLAIRYVVLSELGQAPAGLFQSCVSIALTVGAILAPLSNLYLIPILNRRSPSDDKLRAAELFISNIMLLLILGSVPIVCLPRLVLQVLYSPAFLPAADILFAFVAWQCVFQVTYVYQQLLVALDDMVTAAILALIGFAAAIGLAMLLAPRIGLIGAPVALALGMFFYAVLLRGRLALRHDMAVSSQILLRGGWTVLVVVVGGLMFRRSDELTLQGLGLRAVFAAAVLTLTCLFFLRENLIYMDLMRRISRRTTT